METQKLLGTYRSMEFRRREKDMKILETIFDFLKGEANQVLTRILKKIATMIIASILLAWGLILISLGLIQALSQITPTWAALIILGTVTSLIALVIKIGAER